MCGKFLVANSCGLLYIELDRGHIEFLSCFCPTTAGYSPLLGFFFFKKMLFHVNKVFCFIDILTRWFISLTIKLLS